MSAFPESSKKDKKSNTSSTTRIPEKMSEGNKTLTKIRRHKLAKDDAWIENFLIHGAMGSLATCVDDQPFLVTRNYAYDPPKKAIYLHGAPRGRTYENIQHNNKICFSVSKMGRLLPADKAVEFGVEYSGVIVFGRIQIIEEEKEAAHGLNLLLEKYFPHLTPEADYKPITAESLNNTAVMRIDIDCWSGKATKEREDYPGAFNYPSTSDHS